ncbi:MAG: hypothetical protein ACH37Z_14780 [Anaerolineae bacterium]
MTLPFRDPVTYAGDDAALTPNLPLEALPEGLVVRAMARIAADAQAGRARAVRQPMDARGPAMRPQRFPQPHIALPFLPTVLTLAAFALVAAGGFAAVWVWRSHDPLQQAEFLLNLRQGLLDLRMALRLEPWLIMAIALGLSGMGFSAAALADRNTSGLRPVGRRA